jgi:hypothetical protein
MLGRFSLLVASILLFGCGSEPSADEATSSPESTSTSTSTSTSDAGTSTDTSTESGSEETETTGEPPEDPVLDAEDFDCILDWPKVHRFRITNVHGDVDASVAVANSPDGGVYPIGTLIQLIPTEAMVKRAPGFAPQANDWEFFALSVSAQGTEIVDRGSDQVVNAFGGNCFDCHSNAEPQWDFVCEQDHGCDPLPFTAEQIEAVQNADPRCR